METNTPEALNAQPLGAGVDHCTGDSMALSGP